MRDWRRKVGALAAAVVSAARWRREGRRLGGGDLAGRQSGRLPGRRARQRQRRSSGRSEAGPARGAVRHSVRAVSVLVRRRQRPLRGRDRQLGQGAGDQRPAATAGSVDGALRGRGAGDLLGLGRWRRRRLRWVRRRTARCTASGRTRKSRSSSTRRRSTSGRSWATAMAVCWWVPARRASSIGSTWRAASRRCSTTARTCMFARSPGATTARCLPGPRARVSCSKSAATAPPAPSTMRRAPRCWRSFRARKAPSTRRPWPPRRALST